PVAIPLMAAHAAEVFDQPLPARERRRILLPRRDGAVSADRFLRPPVEREPRQRFAGQTAAAVVGRLEWHVGRRLLPEPGMARRAALLADERGTGGRSAAHVQPAGDPRDLL